MTFPLPLTSELERDLWRFLGVETDDPFCVGLPAEAIADAGLADTPFARAFVRWREEREERSCFTCGHDKRGVCYNPDTNLELAIDEYAIAAGCAANDGGMPTDRTVKCPGWRGKGADRG